MTIEFLVFAGLLACSAFFSASEIALMSVNEVTLHKMIEERGRRARPLRRWIEKPGHYLATILICNNIVNTGAGALATIVTYRFVGGSEGLAVSIATGAATFFILLFGEITPKSFAKAHGETLAMIVIHPLNWLGAVLYPIVHFFTLISNGIVRILSFGRAPTSQIFSEEDLKASFRLGRAKGVLEWHEKEMLTSVLEFSDRKVSEIMVPRVEIDAIPAGATLEEVEQVAIATGYSRFPIYEGTLDQIVGAIHVRDLLAASASAAPFDVRKYLRKPLFLPETLTLPVVLRQMKSRQTHLAMVVNEYGGLEWIVTMEDVLEELVGEIEDEHDEAVAYLDRKEDGAVVVDTRIGLREAARILGFEMPETTVNRLGGFLIERAGRIPRRGDRIVHGDLEFTVLEASRRRLLRVEVRAPDGRSLPLEFDSNPELQAAMDHDVTREVER